jgi:hypothetical protein
MNTKDTKDTKDTEGMHSRFPDVSKRIFASGLTFVSFVTFVVNHR